MAQLIVKNVRLDGIPCQAIIDAYKAEPQTYWEPGVPAGFDLEEVRDRKGYPAPWLENKLDNKVVEDAFLKSIDDQLALSAQDYDYY